MAAQDLAVWLNTSASHAQPPADVTADPSQYGLLGARVDGGFPWGSIALGGRYGSAASSTGGRWLQGDGAITAGRRLGALGLRARLSGFGLRYLDPFAYDAGGVELRPGLSVPAGPFVLSARPRFSFGRWSTDAVEGDLRVLGATVEAYRSFGAVTAALSTEASSVDNGVAAGAFIRAGGNLILDRGNWTASAELELQRTPLETEVGGGLQASWTLRPGVELHGYAGRRVRDPLFGTAGSLTFSLTASVRAARWSPPRPPPVVELGETEAGSREARFAIRAPEADRVALSGDFSGWEPVDMERRDDGWWHVARTLEPGLYHFGFLVDGNWAIPEDAPGVMEDGWGRRNASIVVDL